MYWQFCHDTKIAMSSESSDFAISLDTDISLPPATTCTSASLVPIGRIRTPYRVIEACPSQGDSESGMAILELFEEYETALHGIELSSYIYVLYWLDHANRDRLQLKSRSNGVIQGVFATRSSERPNPVGLSVAKLIKWDKSRITVSALDCIDGTMLIDIKRYIPRYDCFLDASLPWLGR